MHPCFADRHRHRQRPRRRNPADGRARPDRRPLAQPGVAPIAADLLDPASLAAALAGLKPTHVFLTTWLRQATEAENIRVNAAMVRNLLDALRPAGSVRHVALVTGLKHYLGPFEAYGKGALPQTPFREDQARLDLENFYYAQEDEVFAAAARDGFHWSIHRPHTVIGLAVGNAMNMGTTLAAYATICCETGRPFRFPGVGVQWDSLTDMTAARLLARLASPWHTDADLGRPVEVVTDMSKSRRLGFNLHQPTDDAFFLLFEKLRRERLIP